VVHLRSVSRPYVVALHSTDSSHLGSPTAPRRPSPSSAPRRGVGRQGTRALEVLQGSLSARRVERQSPLLAGLHRISTGLLVGLGFSVVGLSGLSLHWQSVWGQNYTQLQSSRVLGQKLQESAALLEQHHLGAVRRPGLLVPTNSNQLVHLDRPATSSRTPSPSLLASLPLHPIPAGY